MSASITASHPGARGRDGFDSRTRKTFCLALPLTLYHFDLLRRSQERAQGCQAGAVLRGQHSKQHPAPPLLRALLTRIGEQSPNVAGTMPIVMALTGVRIGSLGPTFRWLRFTTGSQTHFRRALATRLPFPPRRQQLAFASRAMSVRIQANLPGASQNVIGRSFNIALIQLGSISADKDANLAHARQKIAEAAASTKLDKAVDVVVLPEVFNSPYGSAHFEKYAEVIGWHEAQDGSWDVELCSSPSVKMLSRAAQEAKVWLFGGSIPERSPSDAKVLYNSAPVFSPDGQLVALHRKLHLFDIDIPNQITFKESETLSAGNAPVTIIETPFGKVGLAICYDMRFPEMAMIAARKGCVAMIYPGAFNLTTGPLHWELLQRARAIDNQIYVATCSPARDLSSGYHAWGHSTIVDPMARVVSTTDENECIVVGTIDMKEIVKARAGLPITTQRRFDVYPDIAKLV
ncbi:hypothetical protein O181_013648 [Austropuccinia psidii MF-1]|uniref:CN hydrolase domain-containing protein n=1 Tax=Austropuccinia psidii MF-1 TaxID=1389203 RepID=A0A9Q3GNB2_9BASI|nr:hypothetical protein [Austropuccinia psidii MF-1]